MKTNRMVAIGVVLLAAGKLAQADTVNKEVSEARAELKEYRYLALQHVDVATAVARLHRPNGVQVIPVLSQQGILIYGDRAGRADVENQLDVIDRSTNEQASKAGGPHVPFLLKITIIKNGESIASLQLPADELLQFSAAITKVEMGKNDTATRFTLAGPVHIYSSKNHRTLLDINGKDTAIQIEWADITTA